MADDVLKIRMVIDRSQAKAATDAQVQGSKDIVAATAAATAAIKKSLADQLSYAEVVERAKSEMTAARNRERVESVKAAMAEETGAARRASTAMAEAGRSGSQSFEKMGLSVAGFQVGLEKALAVAAEISRVMEGVAARYRGLTGSFVGRRDQLGELAGIMGRQADNAFTLENQKYNAETGFRPEEGRAFRTELNNAGRQYRGSMISESEFDKFERQAGALAVARDVDPAVVGDVAGTLLGTRDRRGMGDKASGDALGKLNSAMAIMGAGKGDNAVLGRQFSMLNAASMNEDELKGSFTDTDDVATAISLMAEKHDAQAAEMVKIANRGLRDFDGKAADLLKKAGVGARTKFADGIKKLGPVIEAEAREKGVNVEDALKLHFDETTAQALAVAINKGLGEGGVFASREKVAAENAGTAPATKVLADAAATQRVLGRQADADEQLAKDEAGAKGTREAVLRQQADAELEREGKKGSMLTAGLDWLMGKAETVVAPLAVARVFMGSPDEARTRQRERAILDRRARAGGIDPTTSWATTYGTPESIGRAMNESMDAMKTKGVDPLATTNQILKEILETAKRDKAPGAPTPVGPPLPGRIPVATR